MTITHIGRYRIERKLGEGSFASVWLASDPELDDEVAIKVLAPRWSEKAEVHARFMREARLLRKLAGERIVRIHDVDQMDDGQPYFVMEYADRGSLADRISRLGGVATPLGPSQGVSVGKEIAKGLKVAHRAGVIHRDLKPANVLFRSIPAHNIPTTVGVVGVSLERLMLADFGLARALDTASGRTAKVGTPSYAAPEQYEGEPDERSDIYAMTVVLFEMLTGARPFSAGGSLDRRDVPDPREHDESIPESLARFIMGGMDPDPGRRPQSASAWLEGLVDAAGAYAREDEVHSGSPQQTQLRPPPGPVVASGRPSPREKKASAPAGLRPTQTDPARGDLTDELIATSTWSDEDVHRAGIPIVDAPFVTVGGGIGSFVMTDYLRIAGVPTNDIRVLSPTRVPWETYAYLARTSQIPDHERLRSDAGSTPDNIWGFPSYAVREALSANSFQEFIQPLWTVLTEPIFADYYTPKAGQVYESMAREAERIGYSGMVNLGRVRTIRRRLEGGYFVVHTPESGRASTKRVAYRSPFVHVAVGYPGVRFLPDLQRYREEHQDFSHVVAAYEPHDHVYRRLNARGGTVMLRGSGIVASRILQRLIDDRDASGCDVTIWHIFRNYVSGPQGPVFMRRPGADGLALQGFNFPKAAWGGQLRYQLLQLPKEDRPNFIKTIGGTNTAPRRKWMEQLERGKEEGFYRTWVGEAEDVQPGDEGVVVKLGGTDQANLELAVDFVIDATGLEADIRTNPILADILDHTDTRPNPLGRLDVTPTFAIDGADSPPGRLYASGSATLGGPYSPVDSFLGLQYAALQIADDLARNGFGRRIGSVRSLSQWFKWMRGTPI